MELRPSPNTDIQHEAPLFRELEIGPEGAQQITEALALTAHLEGNELDDALMDHFAELAAHDELLGVDAIAEWAHSAEYENEAATVIKPLTPEVEHLSDEVRYRYGVAQTAMVSHVLGTPWSRHYENDGQRIQHVQPKEGHLDVEGSIGMVQLFPHNEVLPTKDGKIICSKFSTLYAVHNTNSGTPTTLYDAQAAIKQLSPEALAILTETVPPRFKWNGTEIEKEDALGDGDEAVDKLLSVLTPSLDENGDVKTYDLIADLDGKTMQAVDGDEAAAAALLELRDRVTEQEAAYTITDGQMLVWRNRKALHGRKPITDINRHLVRSQVGEAEYAEHDAAA